MIPDKSPQKKPLIIHLHFHYPVGDIFGYRVVRRDLDPDSRCLHLGIGQFFDVLYRWWRKKQGLVLRWQFLFDGLNIFQKPFLQHPVRFIQHQGVHPGQGDGPLADEIEHSSRGGHQHIYAVL